MTSPVFSGRKELARYISPDERDGDNHAAVTAFLMNAADWSHREPHLSVNHLETEALGVIAEYYRSVLQDGEDEVAVCIHKIHKYVDNGRKAGVAIRSSVANYYEFDEDEKVSPAFKHRPTPANERTNRPKSDSHCGVEFLRRLDEIQQRRFARAMAKRPRFQTF